MRCPRKLFRCFPLGKETPQRVCRSRLEQSAVTSNPVPPSGILIGAGLFSKPIPVPKLTVKHPFPLHITHATNIYRASAVSPASRWAPGGRKSEAWPRGAECFSLCFYLSSSQKFIFEIKVHFLSGILKWGTMR